MKKSVIVFLILLSSIVLFSKETYKPYILAKISADSVQTVLKANNFIILGEYPFNDSTKILVFTNDKLKNLAKENKHGIYASIIRLAITNGVVSYTNPKYWCFAYRINSEINDIYNEITKVLGNKKEFGSKSGLTEKKLRKYKYMIGMPKFTDLIKIKEFKNHTEAIKQLEKGLKKYNATVYKLDCPSKDETLFGIKIPGDNPGADEKVMNTLNSFTKGELHTAYLPYEVLVSGNNIYILNGKFRIALSFPDLSMGQFMKIKNAPSGIKKFVKKLVVE